MEHVPYSADNAWNPELGIPVVVCNFAAPNFAELGRAREIFAIQVMAYFPEPA